MGVVFPSWCVRAEPLTPLSPLPSRRDRSHDPDSPREPPRPPRAGPRERTDPECDLRCLPSRENLCPATPFQAPGSGLDRLRGLATVVPTVDAFETPEDPLAELPRALIPVRVPVCQRCTLLWISPSFADFCNRIRRAGTPVRAAVPRTRVRLSPHCSPAPTDASCVGRPPRCRAGGLRAAHCTHRLTHGTFHLRGRGSCAGRGARAKANRALLTRSRVPSS